MKSFLFFLCFSLVSSEIIDIGFPLKEDVISLKNHFQLYQRSFNKTYASDEQEMRFEAFVQNYGEIKKLNAKKGAKYGFTIFSDMSKQEFRETMLMKKQALPTEQEIKERLAKQTQKKKKRVKFSSMPAEWDWRSHGVVTAVKNQGQCGSCWAFSTTENVESVWLLANHSSVHHLNLSPQQLVDCSDFNFGCGGGELPGAFTSVLDEHGLETIHQYPYRANTGFCRLKDGKASPGSAKISGWQWKSGIFDEHEVQKGLVNDSPLSICVSAENWQNYQGGVMTAAECGTLDMLDHCVQLVGYRANVAKPHWIVRNSWTASWGIHGYIHLSMWEDTCHMAAMAVTGVV